MFTENQRTSRQVCRVHNSVQSLVDIDNNSSAFDLATVVDEIQSMIQRDDTCRSLLSPECMTAFSHLGIWSQILAQFEQVLDVPDIVAAISICRQSENLDLDAMNRTLMSTVRTLRKVMTSHCVENPMHWMAKGMHYPRELPDSRAVRDQRRAVEADHDAFFGGLTSAIADALRGSSFLAYKKDVLERGGTA